MARSSSLPATFSNRAFVAAGHAAGHAVAQGFNDGPPEGFGTFDFNIRQGRRWTAAAAYLRPALGRRNLTVVTRARALRLTIERGRAVGVAWTGSGGLQSIAAGEVIVSAGAIGSPHLLLLSGIGAAAELRQHGIPVAADLAGVGRNLQNHPDVALRHACPAPVTLHSLLRADRIIPAMLQAWLVGSGPAALKLSDDMLGLAWGKLLINLNNAVKDHPNVAAMPLQDILGKLAEMPEAIRTVLRRVGWAKVVRNACHNDAHADDASPERGCAGEDEYCARSSYAK